MSALIQLFRMQAYGAFRHWCRSFQTVNGAVRGSFAVAFLFLLLVPLFAFRIFSTREFPQEYIERCRFGIENVFPLFILFMLFTAIGKPNSTQSLDFQPAEIDFLFTAPFSRRALLSYKLLGIGTSTIAICLPLTCSIGAFALYFEGSFLAGLARTYLAMVSLVLTVRLISIWSGLIRKSVLIRLVTPLRKALAVAVVVISLISLVSIRDRVDLSALQDPVNQLLPALRAWLESDAFQFGIAPLGIYGNLILSDSIFEFTLWGMVCFSVIGLMLFLVFKTDADFLEQELHYGQMRAEALKKTQSVEASFVSAGQSGTLPMLPFMGGVGPVTWRQLQTFYRTRRLLIVGVVGYFLFVAFLISQETNDEPALSNFLGVIATLSMMTFLAGLGMPMGFHVDTQMMGVFKSLPFSPTRIALGQILGPVLALAIIQYSTILLFMFFALEFLEYWFWAAMFAPLLSTILLCILNSMALIYPTQRRPGMIYDLDNVGHILVFMFLLITLEGGLVGTLIGIGALAYFLTQSTIVVCSICWLVLLTVSIAGVWVTGQAFKQFDISKHGG